MTPPQPPKLNFPSRMPTPGPGRLNVYDPNGKLMRTVSFGQRTDPGFFKNVVAQVRTHNKPIRLGLAMSGFGAAGGALVVASVVNLGNPFLFYDRREQWKDLAGMLEGSRSDLWRSFFDDISPNWKGQAVQTLQQYVRFNVNGLYSQLDKVSGEMSGAMHSQYKEVLEYDLSVFGLYATSAPMLRTVAALSAHPVGKVALMTQVGLFMSAAGNLIKQFADVYNSYEGDLNKLELKLNNLRGAFYKSGSPDLGARELNLTPAIADPLRLKEYWVSASKGAS